MTPILIKIKNFLPHEAHAILDDTPCVVNFAVDIVLFFTVLSCHGCDIYKYPYYKLKVTQWNLVPALFG